MGRNSALLYSMMFLVGIAQVQLPNALVRFLPIAGRHRRAFVAATYAAGTALAAGGAVVFVLGVSVWSPRLVPDLQADHNAWLFVAATGIWAMFVMQDSVLTGLGRAGIVPLENLGFSVLKLVDGDTAAHSARPAHAARGVLRHSLVLVVPAVLVLVLAAPLVLRIFGEEYAEDGVWVLRLAALSALRTCSTRWR